MSLRAATLFILLCPTIILFVMALFTVEQNPMTLFILRVALRTAMGLAVGAFGLVSFYFGRHFDED